MASEPPADGNPPPHVGRTRQAVGRLKRRPEFLAVAGTRRKWATPGLIVQVRPHDATQAPRPGEPLLRVGFTASRKVGGAVERNRARRRLRAAVAELVGANAATGHDLVLIARKETVRRPWVSLKADLTEALRRLKLWRPKEQGGSP